MSITQDGRLFSGTYVSGTVEGTIDGTTATGTWHRTSDGTTGPLTWFLLNGQQFNGNRNRHQTMVRLSQRLWRTHAVPEAVANCHGVLT